MNNNELAYKVGAIPHHPKNGLGLMFSDFDTLFDGMNRSKMYSFSEKDTHYTTTLDMPGVKKEDIEVSIEDNMLKVCAKRNRDGELRDYTTSFLLPTNVDEEADMKAVYEDGVLKIALPKSKAAGKRRIELESKDDGLFERLFSSKKSKKVDVKN